MRSLPLSFALVLLTALAGCGTTPVRDTAPAATHAASTAHDNLNATLWMESAAEYEASVRGLYNTATRTLDTALATPSWHALPRGEAPLGFEALPPAIIVDADETLISNEPAQARAIRDNAGFDYDRWLAWVNEAKARALPGAVEFAQLAASRGVTIFYVTNRDYPAEYDATLKNLRELGFPVADDASNVLLRGSPRAGGKEKGERRKLVAQTHRVVMMFGDNLGDFVDGINTGTAERRRVMAPYASWWGERWFMLPNPAYGSWEGAVLKDCGERGKSDPVACKRDALRYD